MSSINQDKLSSLLSEMANDGTFTKQALATMSNAVDRAEMLETQLAGAISAVESLNKSVETHKSTIKQQDDLIVGFRTREADILKREKTVFELEKAAAVAQASVNTYRECVSLVFRNAEVRKSWTDSVPSTTGYPVSMPASSVETTG